MDPIIYVADALGFGLVDFDCVAQRLARLGQGEGNDRGVAAADRGGGGRSKIVSHFYPRAGGLRDMHMAVDPAWHDDQAGGVDDVVGRAEIRADGRNPAVIDAYIRGQDVRARHHATGPHDGVEAHDVSSCANLRDNAGASPWDCLAMGLACRRAKAEGVVTLSSAM